MKKYRSFLLGVLVFVLPFCLYIYHLAPTYIPIDSAEFTLCMKFWGLCHPPGFPLYVLVGHIFLDLFTFGEVIWRANLLSAIYGALTILFVYLIFLKLKVCREFAFLGAMFLAVSTSFWEFSLSADVFTFGTFLIVLSLYLLFYGKRLPAMFVLGLSASHFYLTAVLWPIYIWYFLVEGKSRVSKMSQVFGIILMGLVFGLGFLPQILMYFRMQANPEINWGHHTGFGGFMDYARRKEFGSGFLLSNPSLIYNPLKNIKQIWFFTKTWFFEFGLLLPAVGVLGVFHSKISSRREYLLLLNCFFVYAFVQLFLLSTIDPSGEGNPFQLNKFYLVPFLFAILFSVLSVDYLVKRFFEEFKGVFVFLVGALVCLYLLVNWQTVSLRGNYFSQNMVLDALDQLSPNSIGITVDHLVYFGALYEQKINNVHTDKTILYFPNEKNRDNEAYHPEFYANAQNGEFMDLIKGEFKLGTAESYVLSTISRNLDREIYILQGDFEYNFFRFLSNKLESYGLWQKISVNDREVGSDFVKGHFAKQRNKDIRKSDFFLKQQASEASIYAVSYYTAGLRLAELGDYTGAVDFLNKSMAVDSSKTNISNDISLVKRIGELWPRFDDYKDRRDVGSLEELADGLLTIKNYRDSVLVYDALLSLSEGSSKAYNNAGSANANLGEVQKARTYYEKSLGLEPDLDVAKKALELLKNK